MNIAKNMEALFIAAALLLCSANFASAALHDAQVAQVTSIPSITISAKRLSPRAKAAAAAEGSAPSAGESQI